MARLTFNLPYKKPEKMSENIKEQLPFLGIKALVCDDDELNQKIMVRQLAKYGVTAETASHGREGLDRLIAEPFDIVFVDLHMPIMNGEQMARLVREHAEIRVSKTPLVAVTGAAYYFQERTLTETHFDSYIVKPFTPQLVLLSLQSIFPKK